MTRASRLCPTHSKRSSIGSPKRRSLYISRSTHSKGYCVVSRIAPKFAASRIAPKFACCLSEKAAPGYFRNGIPTAKKPSIVSAQSACSWAAMCRLCATRDQMPLVCTKSINCMGSIEMGRKCRLCSPSRLRLGKQMPGGISANTNYGKPTKLIPFFSLKHPIG